MIKQLFFLLTIIIFSSTIVTAQTDQDDTNVADIECDNLNPTDFENDLDAILANVAWSDSNTGGCNGVISYIGIDDIVSAPPYTCNTADEVEVDVELECDGNSIVITVFLDPIDTADPFDFNIDGSLEDANVGVEPCDMADLQADLDAWVADIEANDLNANFVFSDNCTNPVDLDINVVNPPVADFTICGDQIYSVDFDVEDECGNLVTFTFEYEVEDTNPPFEEAGANPSITAAVCDMIDSPTELMDWYNNLLNNMDQNGDPVWGDDCTDVGSLIITADPLPSPAFDFTQCVDGNPIEITFTVEDACGNSVDFDYEFDIVDDGDPFLLGSGPPSPVFECDMALTDQEITDWIDDVIANGPGGADYFADNCSSVLTIDVVSSTVPVLDFTDCVVQVYDIDFEIEDECGRVFEWTGQVEVQDNTPPDLDLSGAVTAVIDCDDLGSIQGEVEAAVLGPNVLIDDCTDFSGVTIGDFNITPDPSSVTIADLVPGGNTCYEITFDIDYEDPCGNFSNLDQITIEVDDDVAPDIAGAEPQSGTVLGPFCPNEVVDLQSLIDAIGGPGIDVSNIFDACTDFSVLTVFDLPVLGESYPTDCGNTGFIELEVIDDCGNNGGPYRLEWDVDIGPGNPELEWVGGDPTAFFPPDDITISFADPDCTNELPNCVWEDMEGNMWPWEALLDVHYTGGCDVEVFYSHLPCSMVGGNLDQNPPPELIDFATNSGTPTSVTITIMDMCDGTVLEHEFEITVQCGSCGEVNGSFCETCEDADPLFPDGCRLCDPVDLMEGFDSCNGFCPQPCPVDDSGDQPPSLCNDGGNVPHNMSWFAFVANAESLTLDVEVGDCTTGNGIQVGIYESCDFDDCIIWSGGCTTADQTLNSGNFNLGQTYYLFIDGCNGDDCEFTVSIREIGFLGLPEPDAVTAESLCRDSNPILTNNFDDPALPEPTGDCVLANRITVCPGEDIQFGIIHKGDPDNAIDVHQEECGMYTEDLSATFVWSTTWAGTIEHDPVLDGGGFIPELTIPDEPGTIHMICLEEIIFECDPQDAQVCLELHVEPIQPETYEFIVCIEDLETNNPALPGPFDGPFDPAEAEQDPNGDGRGWLGDNVDLLTVDSWPMNSDGFNCNTFFFDDPDCPNCIVEQTLCIRPIGNREKTPTNVFMWRCQFEEECEFEAGSNMIECDDEPYLWMWDWRSNIETFELEAPDSLNAPECLRVEGYSDEMDSWRPNRDMYCDTIPNVTITVGSVPIFIEDRGCGEFFTSIDFDLLEDEYENWPEVFESSQMLEYFDCNTGQELTSSFGVLQLDMPRQVCVRINFAFDDGAWWDPVEAEGTYGPFHNDTRPGACSSIYGPFDLEASAPVSPTVMGDDVFCETDLEDHEFMVTNPAQATTYVWNANPINPDVMVTDISAAGDGTLVSITFSSDYDPNDCVNVVSEAMCGTSDPPTQVCVTLTPPPTVMLEPIDNVCTINPPDPNAMDEVIVTAIASPPNPNYEYTFFNGTNSVKTTDNFVTLEFPTSGSQFVSVIVEDTLTGCTSFRTINTEFQVLDPLDPPFVSCTNQGQTELEISWDPVTGADGYIVFEDGVMAMQYDDTVLSHTTTGLSLGTTVTYTVMTIGPAPCLNSALSAPVPCTTSDCPQASVMQVIQNMEFCENDSPGVLFLQDDGFTFSEPNGDLTFVSNPPIATLDPDTGEIDTDNLAPGVYDIQATFTFDPLCPDRVFNLSITVLELPDPSFEFETPVCVNDVALLLDAPDGSVTWNYDVDEITDNDPVANADGDIRFTDPGTYTIEALSIVAGCEASTTFTLEVIPELDAPVPVCDSEELDAISASWAAVTDATSYSVAVTVNGVAEPGSPFIYAAGDPLVYDNNTLNEGDEVMIIVTAINDNFASGSCNATGQVLCTASNCATFPNVNITCTEMPGSIDFEWLPIPGIDSFILVNVTDPANPIDIIRTDALMYTADNLGSMEEFILSVEPIHPQEGCTLPAGTLSCIAPCPGVPDMSPITCTDASLDFVTFAWEEVLGVTGYDVIITINGQPAGRDTITDLNITIDNLTQDDEVIVVITALNADVACGNGEDEEQDCVATSCTIPQFAFTQDPECYESGAIQLNDIDVTDSNGDPLPGTIIWTDTRVDADGMFTPDGNISELYEIEFEWADDAFPADCVFPGEIELQVNVRPTPQINPAGPLCAGDEVVISGPAIDDPQVTSVLDYDDGIEVSGDFPDGVTVSFDDADPQIKTITLTQESAPGCDNSTSISVPVSPSQELIVTCGPVTISSVSFMWNAIDGVDGYGITIDGVAQLPTTDTSFEFTGLNSQDPVMITVTPIGDDLCLVSESASVECTPSDCPVITFDAVTLPDFCQDDPVSFTLPGNEILQGTPPAGDLTETWVSNSPAIDVATGAIDPELLEPGTVDVTYTATYTTNSGDECIYPTMYSFTVFERPQIESIIPNDPDCILDEVPTVTINAIGGVEPYTYVWLDNPPTQMDPVYTIPAPGVYDFVVTDANGCSTQMPITISPAPVGEVTIVGDSNLQIGEDGTFTVEVGGVPIEPTSVVWFIDDIPIDNNSESQSILNIVADLEALGREFTVRVEVFFAEDCFLTDTRVVNISDFERWYIPNVVSTGVEGEDARWVMFTQGSVTVQDVAIYDRWGELVYVKELDPLVDVSDDPDPDATGQVWDLGFEGRWGNDGAADVEQGVYVYVINLVVDEGAPTERPEIEAGDVTVFR